jgi:GAF domain-containing protein
MSATESPSQPSDQQVRQLLELTERILMARSFGDLAERALPSIAAVTQSGSVFIYIGDSRLSAPRFLQHGFQPETSSAIEKLCAEQFDPALDQVDLSTSTPDLRLYPLRDEGTYVGLIGLKPQEDATLTPPDALERIARLLAHAVGRLAERAKSEREIAFLNTYLNVSSMLAQSLSLHELLEIALYCCLEVTSAETASVLLLDEQQKVFRFYHVEGPTKPVLMATTFPADKGLAGSVLQTQQSEVINDVQNDPRFYREFDSMFPVRNMIAVPLTAGTERIGVLEVLNKTDGGSFTEEEHLLLQTIGEEIAFAIRNAEVFEYVVSSYCRRRQGETSCRGCDRPLWSWTPCVMYQDSSGVLWTSRMKRRKLKSPFTREGD